MAYQLPRQYNMKIVETSISERSPKTGQGRATSHHAGNEPDRSVQRARQVP